ncbi:MAG TPA: bifunctional glutamate N-acetyltransferase/amino-acid acetyltransferase ArgJ [Thermoanaerobaculia bacterium]|nr:bifunctional glutamate N-acetyltransferase/amino-acid acetyltransferase ArgJ [Thermoanaerobaculia bacterium]
MSAWDREMEAELAPIEGGGITSPRGFRASAVASGIKRSGLDLALIVSVREASVAGMFTSNRVRAAPVRWCERIAAQGVARAILANSGNANACTGPQGERDAERMAAAAGRALDLPADRVLVASTGVIGHPLPVERIEKALPAAVAGLGGDGRTAAEAIMTTDTRPKSAAIALDLGGRRVALGGIAKGAGMIGPDLVPPRLDEPLHATILLFLTTDAAVAPVALREALRSAIDVSFNAITVDGDTSTNDTALLLANGEAGGPPLDGGALEAFTRALTELTRALALEIVRDGEGATRVIRIEVTGAPSREDAKRVAMTVANSPLVKTAFSAGEPNWGRLLMAVGRSGVAVEEPLLSVRIGGLQIVERGLGAGTDLEALRAAMSLPEAEVSIDLGLGSASFTAWTCDLSEEYVRINAHYLT